MGSTEGGMTEGAQALDLDALTELIAEATPAPWGTSTMGGHGSIYDEGGSGTWLGEAGMEPDAALIVALRNAAPALITAARSAASRLHHDDCIGHMAEFAGMCDCATLAMLADASRDRAEAERDAAQAALARVEALHFEVTVQITASDGSLTDRAICQTCTLTDGEHILRPEETVTWPCATIRAVAGEGQEAEQAKRARRDASMDRLMEDEA